MLPKSWKVTVLFTGTYTPARCVSLEFLNATSSQPSRAHESRVPAVTLNQLSSALLLLYLETNALTSCLDALTTMMLPVILGTIDSCCQPPHWLTRTVENRLRLLLFGVEKVDSTFCAALAFLAALAAALLSPLPAFFLAILSTSYHPAKWSPLWRVRRSRSKSSLATSGEG